MQKEQKAQPAEQAPSNNNSPSSSVISNDGGLFESSTSEKFADKIFDTNSDSVDWDNGSINWKGKTYSIGNSRVVRARFERYLATDLSSQGVDDYKEFPLLQVKVSPYVEREGDQLTGATAMLSLSLRRHTK